MQWIVSKKTLTLTHCHHMVTASQTKCRSMGGAHDLGLSESGCLPFWVQSLRRAFRQRQLQQSRLQASPNRRQNTVD